MLEFCLAVPVVLLLTLGVLDIAKANIIKLENQQAMQAYISKISASKGDTNDTKITTIKRFAANYMQQSSMFCTKVSGASSQPKCNAGVDPIKTTIRIESANPQKVQAGTQICMAAKSEYKPYYSGVYSKGTMKVYSRACTLMETTRVDSGGFDSIAKGEW